MNLLTAAASRSPTTSGRHLLEAFERIRIISLPHRTDRRREISSELARLGLEVDGRHIAFHDASRPQEAGEFPSIGARGCFESHLAVLQDTLSSGARNVLVFEDDLDFEANVEKEMPAVLGNLMAQDWAIFYGGYELLGQHLVSDRDLQQIHPELAIQTSHFVAFSREAVRIAVPFLREMAHRRAGDTHGGPMHVDGAYNWLRHAHPELKTLIAVPELGHQRPSMTDIHPLHFIDKVQGLRNLTKLLRKLRRRLVRK